MLAGMKDKHRFVFFKYVPPRGKEPASVVETVPGDVSGPQEEVQAPEVAPESPVLDGTPEVQAVPEINDAGDMAQTGLSEEPAVAESAGPEESAPPDEPAAQAEPAQQAGEEEPVQTAEAAESLESEEPAGSGESSEQVETAPSGEPRCPENTLVHVIQEGDTFWKLAKKYGTTVEAISDANPDVDPLNLQTGETLCIPVDLPGAGD